MKALRLSHALACTPATLSTLLDPHQRETPRHLPLTRSTHPTPSRPRRRSPRRTLPPPRRSPPTTTRQSHHRLPTPCPTGRAPARTSPCSRPLRAVAAHPPPTFMASLSFRRRFTRARGRATTPTCWRKKVRRRPKSSRRPTVRARSEYPCLPSSAHKMRTSGR